MNNVPILPNALCLQMQLLLIKVVFLSLPKVCNEAPYFSIPAIFIIPMFDRNKVGKNCYQNPLSLFLKWQLKQELATKG